MAIIISAVSLFFYANGGELAAVPGIILEGLVNVVIVEITSGPKTRLGFHQPDQHPPRAVRFCW